MACFLSKQPRSSLPVRGAWIEIAFFHDFFATLLSLPVRGAWIEICQNAAFGQPDLVAPRAGSVD